MPLDDLINDRVIDGIELTPREIEVLACLICGQKVNKQIAFILSITEKTAQIHISNILKKIDRNSREQIIDWLKQLKNQQELIGLYNQKLLPEALFKETLEKIAFLLKKNEQGIKRKSCLILYNEKQQEHVAYLKKLLQHLPLLGIQKISSAAKEHYQNVKQVLENVEYSPDICLCIVPWDQGSSSGHQKYSLDLSAILKQKRPLFLEAIFLNIQDSAKVNLEKRKHVNVTTFSNYYLGFFELIKKIWTSIDIEPFVQKFQQMETSMIFQYEKKTYLTKTFGMLQATEEEKRGSHWSIDIIKQGKSQLFIGVFLCVTSVFSIYFTFKGQENNSSINHKELLKVVHSHLSIPVESALLLRPKLIKQIENKLYANNNNSKISTVALGGVVGMGGVGKTTLARYYARSRSRDFPVIWEINAETKESLSTSFKDLAFALANTPELKKELNSIENIQDSKRQEKELLTFVKVLLKSYSQWLLIYDNAENLADVRSYLPDDSEVWGNGKVLLTSRDTNLLNTNFIQDGNVIQINELSDIEAITLFVKILYNCCPDKLTSLQQRKIAEFLRHIPSFPLDVSIAARYIKNTHISLETYLERIQRYSEDFEKIQENLIKESSDYSKTRYAIVASSIKRFLDDKPTHKELLLLTCFLDSQNIPLSLLRYYKKEIITEDFIYSLKKEGLITSDNDDSYSIHRSTQAIGFVFLKKLLSINDLRGFIEEITTIVKSYQESCLNNNERSNKRDKALIPCHALDCNSLVKLIPHLEKIYENIEKVYLSGEIKKKYKIDLFYMLGNIHHYCSKSAFLAQKYFSQIVNIKNIGQVFADERSIRTLNFLSANNVDLDNYDEALLYAKQGLELAEKYLNTDVIIIAEFLKHIGYSYGRKNDFEKAKAHYEMATRKLAKHANDSEKSLYAEIYAQLSLLYNITYLHADKKNHAKNYALKALRVLNNDGIFYNNQTVPPKSLFHAIKHKWILGKAYNTLGEYKLAVEKGFREAEFLITHSHDNHRFGLLSGLVKLGKGETLLREGFIREAESNLSEFLNISKNIWENIYTFEARILRAEAKIRLEKLKEAYEDIATALNQNIKEDTNYKKLLDLMCLYHAAFIKYKQKDTSMSLKHFSEFLSNARPFCKSFLDKDVYQTLEIKGTFSDLDNGKSQNNKSIKEYFQQAAIIFSAIYYPSHPFVRDYILRN